MRRAILVASSRFEDAEFPPLQYPVRDAERFRDVLADPRLCGFDEVDLIANEDSAGAKRRLERCARLSEPGDLILFYYNGHGKLDRDGSLALAMPESDSDILRATSLGADEVKSLFNLSRASQRVMILDCCYSGAADSHGFKGGLLDSINALAQQFTGSFLLTASRRFERAWELEAQRAGALTEALVEGVRTGAAAPPGSDQITLAQLAAYVRRSVPATSPQQPEYWDSGGIGEVVFARKLRAFDAAWVTRARRLVTGYVRSQVLDEELAEELREVIGASDRTRHAERLALIDRLVARDIRVSAFVTAWARTRDAAPAPTPPPSPPPSSARSLAPRLAGGQSGAGPPPPPSSDDAVSRMAAPKSKWPAVMVALLLAAIVMLLFAIVTDSLRNAGGTANNTATTGLENVTAENEAGWGSLENDSKAILDVGTVAGAREAPLARPRATDRSVRNRYVPDPASNAGEASNAADWFVDDTSNMTSNAQ